MSTKYEELVSLVREWANRDSNVLPDNLIKSAIRYTAEAAYSFLEIPPLEHTTYFVASEDGALPSFTGSTYPNARGAKLTEANGRSQLEIPVPEDAVSFIVLRKMGTAFRDDNADVVFDDNGAPTISSAQYSLVFNEKADIRTFHDMNADKTSSSYWTRQGSTLLVSGNINKDDVIELHYYRRLSAMNATLELPYGLTKAQAEADTESYLVITTEAFNLLSSADKEIYEKIEDVYVTSTTEKYNWLRDDNEQALLYGALHRVFDFLQEEDQSMKYNQRFMLEIEKLNREETNRKASGGNIKINFSGHGHI